MRDRLVALFVGATIAVIVLYGVPRAYFLADLVRDQHQREVQRAVDTVAAAVSVQEANDVPVTRSFLAQTLGDEEGLVHVAADGTSTVAGDVSESDDSGVVASAAVAGGGRVTLTRSGDVVQHAVADALMPLVLLGLGLLVTSVLSAVFIARRLSRPFQELAGAATALGQGRFDHDVPHYSIPEAEAIGSALRKSAAQLDILVQREREFAVHASHELLTPITGLNLQLEDLRLWPETTPPLAEELQAALETLDRLGSTIQGLLIQDRATRGTSTLDVDLSALAQHVVEDWQRTRSPGQREVRFESSGSVRARVVPEELTQLLETLLEHATRHADETVVVDCAELDTHLRVRIRGAGRTGAASAVTHRQREGSQPEVEGLGRAAELAETLGGYLACDEGGTARFVLMLPRRVEQQG